MNQIEEQLAQMEEHAHNASEMIDSICIDRDIPLLIKALRRALKHFDAHLYPSVMADIAKDLAGEESK